MSHPQAVNFAANSNPFVFHGQNHYLRVNPIGIPLGSNTGIVSGSGDHFYIIFRDCKVTTVADIPQGVSERQIIRSAAITRFDDSPNWIRLFQCGSGTGVSDNCELYLPCAIFINEPPIIFKLEPVTRFDFSINHNLDPCLNEIANTVMDLYVYMHTGHELFIEMWQIKESTNNNLVKPKGPADTALFGGDSDFGLNVEAAIRHRGGHAARPNNVAYTNFDDIDEMFQLQLPLQVNNPGGTQHIHLYIIMFHIVNQIVKGPLSYLSHLSRIQSLGDQNAIEDVAHVIAEIFDMKHHPVWFMIRGFCDTLNLINGTLIPSVGSKPKPEKFHHTWVRQEVGEESHNYMVVFQNGNINEKSAVKFGSGNQRRATDVGAQLANHLKYPIVNSYPYSNWLYSTSSNTDFFWRGVKMESLCEDHLSNQVRRQTTVSHIVEFLFLSTHFMKYPTKPDCGDATGGTEVMWWDHTFVKSVCRNANNSGNRLQQPNVPVSTFFPEQITFKRK